MGLQWGDILNDAVHIQRAINEKGKQTNGKNEFADRFLPQTKYTRALFSLQAAFRGEHSASERVFGDYSEITYRFRWKRYCTHNHISYVTPYELRHTFASIYKNALPLWQLDEMMGHVHPGMTLGVYSHSMDGDADGLVILLESELDKQIERGRKAYCVGPALAGSTQYADPGTLLV